MYPPSCHCRLVLLNHPIACSNARLLCMQAYVESFREHLVLQELLFVRQGLCEAEGRLLLHSAWHAQHAARYVEQHGSRQLKTELASSNTLQNVTCISVINTSCIWERFPEVGPQSCLAPVIACRSSCPRCLDLDRTLKNMRNEGFCVPSLRHQKIM